MAIVFSRSVRSIESDGYGRSGLVFAAAVVLVGAWAAWFFFARIAVVEVAESARLEVDQAAHTIDTPVAGRLASIALELGQEVHAGDVLAEIDSEPLRLSLREEETRQASYTPQIDAIRQQVAADARVLEDQRRVAQVRIDESHARQREAESALTLAEGERDRTIRMHAERVASGSELEKAKADAEQKRAVLDGTKLTSTRIEAEQRASEAERRANIARLQKELADLEGQKATSAAKIEELRSQIAMRQIRAPVTGRVGEVANLRVGAVLKEGDKLGAIVPSGTVRIVAEFAPAAAIGRVKPGQTARMRPDGFPWTQYGMLAATVQRVANEPRSGRIRVELGVDAPASSPIPIQHGLPGTLEIDIERVSPATLVFRTAGRRLSTPATPRSERAEPSPK